MANHLYIEIQVICIVFFSVLLYRLYNSDDNRTSQLIFKVLITTGLFCFVFDAAQAVVKEIDPSNIYCIYLFNIAYYIVLAVCSYLWFIYSESEQGSTKVTSRAYRLAVMVPALVVCGMAISVPFNHWLFYIDEQGNYLRGDWHFLQLVISYTYIVVSGVRAFMHAAKTKEPGKKHHYRIIGFMIVPVAFCGLCQIFLPNLPILCVGYCDSLLFCYISLQEEHISVDPLTSVNNRRGLNRHLDTLLDNALNEAAPFGLLVIDVDKFKSINDTYGHLEGDNALKHVARAISSVGEEGLGVYRYGGDEFVVTSNDASDAQLRRVASNIKQAVAAEHDKMGVPYNLSVSIGYSKFKLGDTSAAEIIERADANLYEEKHIKQGA